jgi:ketopantoate reductase
MSAPVIIGAGRIGTALAERSHAPLLSRTSDWSCLEEGSGAPILVGVRNDDLPAVLERVPRQRWGDLVFVQNGMLDDWLAEQGLSQCTRGVLYFAVAKKHGPLEVGGSSPFTGPHAEAVVRWLAGLGLPAEVVDRERFTAAMLEKLIWNSALGLLSQACACELGTVLDAHADELRALVEEMATVGRAALGVATPVEELLSRLEASARPLAHLRLGVKEWRWRNGWFVSTARRLGMGMPVHEALLARAGLPAA